VDVNLLHHLETLGHAVSPIKKSDEKPYFVFIPDAFHDKNPLNICTLEISMSKRFFYLFLFPDGSILQVVLFDFFNPFIKVESF
jgi:pilus assembly protein TadC